MSLVNAVKAAGLYISDAKQSDKKRYSELLSKHLAYEIADGLRSVGFPSTKPERDGKGEKQFQGGLGPKRVDVSYSDEQHGLIMAVSIKTISFPPYGKNLKNRFSDLCAEAITLHMRFPYSVVCMLFAFPEDSDQDRLHSKSTFQRATYLMRTLSGRKDYTNPPERFENATMMLFQPVKTGGPEPWVKLFNSDSGEQMTEQKYFNFLKDIYNQRNPHALIGLDLADVEEDDDEVID